MIPVSPISNRSARRTILSIIIMSGIEAMGKTVTYYTEYDKEVLFEKIEGLINPFINYVKERKKLDDDYFESEYNPNVLDKIKKHHQCR